MIRQTSPLLDKLDEGYDVVSGCERTPGQTNHSKIPSMLANKIISWIGGVP